MAKEKELKDLFLDTLMDIYFGKEDSSVCIGSDP
jgi:hypothetical protein